MKKKIIKPLLLFIIFAAIIALAVVFIKTSNKDNELSIYNLERPMFYKEIEQDGVKYIAEMDDLEEETTCYFKYSISNNDYTEIDYDEELPYQVTFESKNKDYTLNVLLGSGKFASYHDIVAKNIPLYEIVDINEDYKIGNVTVLRQEYNIDEVKYLEYYYLYKRGFYIKYTFKSKRDYKFNYGEIEKILKFDLEEKQESKN